MRMTHAAGPARSGVSADDPTSLASTLTEDGVAALLGLAIIVALHLDGRAHVLGLPDSFFTPWHGFLYGSLLALVVWLAVMSRTAALRQRSGRVAALPAGYGFAVVGAGLFAAGGVSDMVWHQFFGVESGIDALLSPTHLLLFVGGVFLMSGPIRASRRRALAPSSLSRVPATVAVLNITSIASFVLLFLSGFVTDSPAYAIGTGAEGTREHVLGEALAVAGLGSFVITSVVIVAALVYVARSGLQMAGTTMFLVPLVALLAATVEDLREPVVVVAVFTAAALTDVILSVLRGRHVSARTVALTLAAVLPLLLWSGRLLATHMTQGVLWSLEMVVGVVVVSALASFLTVLALGPPSAAVEPH